MSDRNIEIDQPNGQQPNPELQEAYLAVVMDGAGQKAIRSADW